jgi:hypothetical protein
LYFTATGDNNTALGFNAGYGASGISFNNCTFIGAKSNLTVARTNVTMLGYGIINSQCTSDNQVIIGDTNITSFVVKGAYKGTSSASPNLVVDANGQIMRSTASNWGLTGNAGTTPGANFIGTTDDKDVVIKRNNVQAGLLNNILGNTSWGISALNPSTTGTGNTANGNYSLYSNTTGSQNSATGIGSLYNNTTGSQNTATGYQSLLSNTTGYNNTANGYQSLLSNTTGYNNTANGLQSLVSNTTGYNNTANGYGSLNSNTTGNYNTANGFVSLNSNITGSSNTANGYASLNSNTTGSNNTALGYYADMASGSLNNVTVIGANATATVSNQIVLGDNAVVGIYSSGNNITYNPTIVTYTATGTVTGASIVSGYIVHTGAAATLTLPTMANLITAINGTAAVTQGTSLSFRIDNSVGTASVTLAINTGITAPTAVITGGNSLTIAKNTVGLFNIVFITATTAYLYRVY